MQSIELDDYFSFIINRTKHLDLPMEGAAARYHVTAELAGRLFEDITIDIGFGDPIIAGPELVRGPMLLSFADIPQIEVPVLPLEQHTAEKVHAYTRRYAAGQASTRVKDLIDLVLIASHFSLQADRLHQALQTTFTTRRTHLLPAMLPAPPAQWRPAYRRLAGESGMDQDLDIRYEHAKLFLAPVLRGSVSNSARWNPTLHTW